MAWLDLRRRRLVMVRLMVLVVPTVLLFTLWNAQQKSPVVEDASVVLRVEKRAGREGGGGDKGEQCGWLAEKLRQSVEFLELKDTRVKTNDDRTWFMSSVVRPTPETGDVEFLEFPPGEGGRHLCFRGRSRNDGTQNSYGFAYGGYLPPNSTLLGETTIIIDNDWDYRNPWHALNALVGLAAWRMRNGCQVPARLVLYHWGELVTNMGLWIANILEATFGMPVNVDHLEYPEEVVCFNKASVHRRGLGHASLKRIREVFDMVRCRAWNFCKVRIHNRLSHEDGVTILVNMTLLLRSGSRSFKNESAVVATVARACNQIPGCTLNIVNMANLNFCQQVELMSRTDVLVSTHGGQLTNMVFMPKGSSIMEMFPKGWFEYAGSGQYVFKWLANWVDLKHEGQWRDTTQGTPNCTSKDNLECFFKFKDIQVGHNETHLASWALKVVESQREIISTTRDNKEGSLSIFNTSCACDT